MRGSGYKSLKSLSTVNRRDFLKVGCGIGTGLLLGNPTLWAQEQKNAERPKTNIDEVLKVPKTELSLPGRFPGKVVQLSNDQALIDNQPIPDVIDTMFQTGIEKLTGKSLKESFGLFFTEDDVVGIKVNPVGSGLISTRLELVDSIVKWLEAGGLPRENIVIWDRFDYMLEESGFTTVRYPGIKIEGLQTMDEAAASGETDDNSRWLDENGSHVSLKNFDRKVYYWADVDAPEENGYLNQHVVNDKYSFFGKLLTRKLTKIINVPVFKNTGNGISMATKNLGYGAICNTGRLHRPLFFDVCTEVLAFPVIRDKLVLNITDGLRAQYDGGPMPVAKFTYPYKTLFFATDPFALDMTCHNILVKKRKEMEVNVNEHPRFTEYLRYGDRLGLGIADPAKIEHIIVG